MTVPDGGSLALVATLGLGVGLLSGLLGIGGGVVMAPALLLLPPLFGLHALGVGVVTGVTALQSFVAAALSAHAHAGRGRTDRRLVLAYGLPMWAAGLVGSWIGGEMRPDVVLAVLAGMTSAAALLMAVGSTAGDHGGEGQGWSGPFPAAIVVGAVIGALAGVIGQGGAFLYLPAMVMLLGVPTRLAIASAPVLGTPSAAMILAGRIADGQMPWILAGAALPGLVVGARAGAVWSYRLPTRRLRQVLAAVIALAAIELWRRLLSMS